MLTHEGCRPSHRIGVPNGNLVPQEPGLFDPSDIRCISNIRCLPSEDIGQSSIVPVIDVSDLAHADVVGMIWLSRMTICASRLVSSDLDRVSDWSGLVAISQTHLQVLPSLCFFRLFFVKSRSRGFGSFT